MTMPSRFFDCATAMSCAFGRSFLLSSFKYHGQKMLSVLFKLGSHLPGMPTHLVAGSTSPNHLRPLCQAATPTRSNVTMEL